MTYEGPTTYEPHPSRSSAPPRIVRPGASHPPPSPVAPPLLGSITSQPNGSERHHRAPQGDGPNADRRRPQRLASGLVVAMAFVLGALAASGGFLAGFLWGSSDPGSAEPLNIANSTNVSEDGAIGAARSAGADSVESPAESARPGDELGGALSQGAAVADRLGPSVVQVETDRGLGSGVVYDDGHLLTNHHVIAGAGQIRVRTADGRLLATSLVGSSERHDIAVLRLSDPDASLPRAGLADADSLRVGDPVFALGSPFQLQQTLTAGIISALNRPVPNGDGSLSAMIQTDAPINPGNSGGALANSSGEVIGINTSIRSDGSGNIGIGFAVPIDVAVDVAERIRAGQSLDGAVLGVTAADGADDAVGVLIGEVTGGSAADEAGLRAGDRVIALDGAPVTDFVQLAGLVQSQFPDDVISLEVEREGERLTLQARLGSTASGG